MTVDFSNLKLSHWYYFEVCTTLPSISFLLLNFYGIGSKGFLDGIKNTVELTQFLPGI